MDDIEKLRRKRAIKVILTDIFMACSVIAIVFILVAAVAGWRINSDFTVEQNGLVSIKTKPTGASVIIDGENQFQNTNMSKMLSGGEHKIALEKDGYERWEKTIKITPGWLLRLEYPRLFKQNREKSEVKNFESLKFFRVSPDHSTAIFAESSSTEWAIATDFNANPKYTKINLKGIFSGTDNGNFNLEIKDFKWSKNNEKILLHVKGAKDEWGIINLKNIKESINLTGNYTRFENNSKVSLKKSKNVEISNVEFENDAGDKVLAVINNNLLSLDLSAKTITNKVAENVESFTIFENNILYKTTFEEGKNYLKFTRLGEDNSVIIAVNSEEDAVLTFALTRFNSASYLLYTLNNHLYVYRANDFPNSSSTKLNMKPILSLETGIIASEASVSLNKEFVIFREGARVIVFDAELELPHEYDYGDEQVRFLDNYLLYRVDTASGKFLVWDFDSTNVRTLVVDKAAGAFDALLSNNNKYFYYIAKNDTNYSLVRETL